MPVHARNALRSPVFSHSLSPLSLSPLTLASLLQASKDKKNLIESELGKLLAQEQAVPADQKEALKKLWALVQRNEKMKREEKDFKEACKKKLEAMQVAIKDLDETKMNTAEEEARMKEIDDMFAKIEDKWNKVRGRVAQVLHVEEDRVPQMPDGLEQSNLHLTHTTRHARAMHQNTLLPTLLFILLPLTLAPPFFQVRQLLAQRNLQVAATSRKIDDVPTRTEMIQYERRFVELYQQVGLKLEETRRYYAMYNTLDKTREFLGKEVKLIDSITNSFEHAMQTTSSQAEFAAQFDAILKGVESTRIKQEGTLKKKQDEVIKRESDYMEVVDAQRRYFKTVKAFQEECQRNEALVGKAEELGVEIQ